ncbi:hypothetical protein [uncultured Gimesia sp.]|uniref:hypothetical protein n=1 Tax=uncultured Gimesia sp. TaxID=1678688 RepID=UPI0030DC3309|tara:strand:- start:5548 stop:6033 length:486 start_codon:yes stop_codon:yes gene_type:complete
MTLQHRIRSNYKDQTWNRKIYLTEKFLLDSIDDWARSEKEFPIKGVVSGILYLFSSRYEAESINDRQLKVYLQKHADSPEVEYSLTWPKQTASQGQELIDLISKILSSAIAEWSKHGSHGLTVTSVLEQIVDQIMKQQYVVFHHHETTIRDRGGFGGKVKS